MSPWPNSPLAPVMSTAAFRDLPEPMGEEDDDEESVGFMINLSRESGSNHRGWNACNGLGGIVKRDEFMLESSGSRFPST